MPYATVGLRLEPEIASLNTSELIPASLTGGAGVVSKDIDGKPFYDSLSKIMAEAYSFAKKGSKDSGRNAVTGIDVAKTCKLDPILLALFLSTGGALKTPTDMRW